MILIKEAKQAETKNETVPVAKIPMGPNHLLFYKSREELINMLVPFFKIGLENNQYCIWGPTRLLNKEDGSKAIKELNDTSHKIIQTCLDKGAQLEAVEESDLLTEFLDWSRCLVIGLQNQKVFTRVYDSYLEVSKKRNEYIAGKIDETLKTDETGILLMRENHQVQFPSDIQVFYVAPPALDEITRWLRERS